MIEWIPVTERSPRNGQWVLVWRDYGHAETKQFHDGSYRWRGWRDVAHWAEINPPTKPPKERE